MNPRYAAALALVGCYLLIPPLGGGKPDATAPLRRWYSLTPLIRRTPVNNPGRVPISCLSLSWTNRGLNPGYPKKPRERFESRKLQIRAACLQTIRA